MKQINLFDMDWSDLSIVTELADRLGSRHIVIKHDARDNYNIVHVSRTDLWRKPGVSLIYRSSSQC